MPFIVPLKTKNGLAKVGEFIEFTENNRSQG